MRVTSKPLRAKDVAKEMIHPQKSTIAKVIRMTVRITDEEKAIDDIADYLRQHVQVFPSRIMGEKESSSYAWGRLDDNHKRLSYKTMKDNASDDLLLHLAPANRGTRNVQPFLVCSKTGQERRGIYYIMTDGHLIQVGANAIIAFDILLKLHYCFDVDFASDLVNFYDFITACVMQLHQPKGCSIALETTLQNVTLKENDESDDGIEDDENEMN
ncbi:uncharacterized protein LOC112467998 [Temnothorax curvispinosus]|uniref:Uncharacterized protein LOC112467998 n=1 Tax=Temnothorax curvispinosus TaxID=300111 RepID=A0A6J1RJ89_9HYME|nr:uncharacterized protein LOC112467998 [Temnothorax curvispinosus]